MSMFYRYVLLRDGREIGGFNTIEAAKRHARELSGGVHWGVHEFAIEDASECTTVCTATKRPDERFQWGPVRPKTREQGMK